MNPALAFEFPDDQLATLVGAGACAPTPQLDLRRQIRELTRQAAEREFVLAQLRESEARLRQLAENIQEVFWITDISKSVMIYVSPAYETIWGRTCASLYASPRNWLDAIHPDDRECVEAAAASRQVEGTYDEVYRILRPDGSVRWVRDRAFPVRDAQGETYRIAGIAQDITAQKANEERLHEQASL